MISVSREEREWFLRNIAQGLVDYIGAVEPPVPVEEMLRHPPAIYELDFGVVDMYSNLWDATFARPPSRRGSIFVRVNLSPTQRRFALARETLSALITSRHGRELGLAELLMEKLQESAEYFARHLLVPKALIKSYRLDNKGRDKVAKVFEISEDVADARLLDNDLNIDT